MNEFDLILFFVVDPTRRGHFVLCLRVLHGFYILGCMESNACVSLSLCTEHITILNLICIIELHFKHFDFSFIKSQKEYDSEGFPL